MTSDQRQIGDAIQSAEIGKEVLIRSALNPIDLGERQRLIGQPIVQVLLLDLRREMIEHARRDVDGVHGVTLPGEERGIDAGARVEFQNPIGGLHKPQDVIVHFAAHASEVDVIVAERIVLIGLA